MSDDVFARAFTSEGFSQVYSRKLRPQTRDEKIADFRANEDAHRAAQGATMREFLTGEKPAAAAKGQVDESAPVWAPEVPLTPTQRAALAEINAELEVVDANTEWELSVAERAEFADEWDDDATWGYE